jgi:uncharacterized protein YacL
VQKTLLTIRVFFFALCIFGSWLVWYANKDWEDHLFVCLFMGGSLGALVILVDLFLKGFSLRGLTAVTFGLFVGWLIAYFISTSPLFESGEPQTLFMVRLVLFIVLMYLGSVIALRGRDEFNLVIPYIRFVPHGVEVPLVVVDTSALIDGRLVDICASKFMGYGLIVPRFVLDELHRIADSADPQRQAKGRKGLDSLNALNALGHIDIRIHESDVSKRQNVDAKLIFLAHSLKAKIITTDVNLAKLAKFDKVDWLNIYALAKALNPEMNIGETLDIELVKAGKEQGQAVGFLNDGSMVVVNDAISLIGGTVNVEVQSILPSAGGKMIFAKVLR